MAKCGRLPIQATGNVSFAGQDVFSQNKFLTINRRFYYAGHNDVILMMSINHKFETISFINTLRKKSDIKYPAYHSF